NLASEATAACGDPGREEFPRCKPLPDLPRFLTSEQHQIHLVGVAGSGMSGLAGLLISLGHAVSGSDKATTTETDLLQQLRPRLQCAPPPQAAGAPRVFGFFSSTYRDNPHVP